MGAWLCEWVQGMGLGVAQLICPPSKQMQMLSVMKHDVEPVLMDIADWIDETFARAAEDRNLDMGGDARPPTPKRSFSLVKASEYKETSPERPLGSADLGAPLVADTVTDDEEDDMLSFSTKRTRQLSSTLHTLGNSNLPDRQRVALPESQTWSFESGDSLNGPVTPPGLLDDSRFDTIKPSRQARGSYAFFTQKKAEAPRVAAIGGQKPRTTSPASTDHAKGGLSEAELLRRRRVEAVYGMVDEPLPRYGRDDDEEEEEKTGFRW